MAVLARDMGVDDIGRLFGPVHAWAESSRRSDLAWWRLGTGVRCRTGELFRLEARRHEPDRLKELQTAYVASAGQKMARAYHFGSQGPGDVFSNHTSHTNRLVPVYVFGKKADLGAVMGENSRYRDPEKIKATYGFLPENTVNPRAVYADQSDLYRVQKEAVARGVKHLFIVWFDGLDWPTTQAAAIVKTGKVYTEGKGSGLIFQDYDAGGTAQYGFVVTSPTHDQNRPDVDTQTVVIPPTSLGGGYDARIAGPNPWTLGPLGPEGPRLLQGAVGQRGRPGGCAGRRRRPARLHRLVAERGRDGQRGQVVQQRGERHRRRPAGDDAVSRAPGPGMEGRHGHQRAVSTTSRPPPCTPRTSIATTTRTSPGRCSACRESSRRRARPRSGRASTSSWVRASGSSPIRSRWRRRGRTECSAACSSPTPIWRRSTSRTAASTWWSTPSRGSTAARH